MYILTYRSLNKIVVILQAMFSKGISSMERYLEEFLLRSGPGVAHCIAIHLMESAATEVHLMNT